jgi:hypothetical protein
MSWRTVRQVLESPQPTGLARMVKVVIAEHENADDGYAWPSVETIAAEAAITARHAGRIIVKLEKGGHIAIQRRGGRGNSNRYRVLNPDTAMSDFRDGNPDTAMSPFRTRNPDISGLNPDISGLNPDTAMSDEPENQLKRERFSSVKEAVAVFAVEFADRPVKLSLSDLVKKKGVDYLTERYCRQWLEQEHRRRRPPHEDDVVPKINNTDVVEEALSDEAFVAHGVSFHEMRRKAGV